MEAPESEIVQGIDRAELSDSRWGRFGYGLSLPFRMIGVLWRHRRLWKFVLIPVLLSIIIFAALAVGLITYAPTMLEWIWPYPGGETIAWIVLWYAAFVLTVALLGVVALFSTTVLSGVVASPFNDVLSMRAESLFSDDPPDEESDEAFWREIGRSLGASVALMAMYGGVMVPLFFLSFTPVGFIAGGLQLVASSWFVAVEYTDTPLSRRGLGFRQRLRFLRNNLSLTFGFGAGAAMLMAVPFLGLLTVPLAVLGGTAFAAASHDA